MVGGRVEQEVKAGLNGGPQWMCRLACIRNSETVQGPAPAASGQRTFPWGSAMEATFPDGGRSVRFADC